MDSNQLDKGSNKTYSSIHKNVLIDKHQRFMRKLRVSLTDACNFRCFYCMPINSKFIHKNNYLNPDKIFEICEALVDFGVSQIRITGGEPTIRKEFADIVNRIGTLNLEKYGLTTNGFKLEGLLQLLKEANCLYVNVSLDSLKEEKFKEITNSNDFNKVIKSILKAKELGFHIKVNTVLLKNRNSDEIYDFVKFSEKYDIPVRFLELMKIGLACNSQEDLFISAKEVIEEIRKNEELNPILSEKDSTSFNFISKKGAKIGFIASESQPFCDSCSRLRLSATGQLRACLMSSKGIDIKNIDIRNKPHVLSSVIGMKPNFRLKEINQNMNQIGG